MSCLLSLPEALTYHLYRKETDMRKSFNALSGIVRNELGRTLMTGDVFIFINKPRTHIKLLLWEKGGFTLFYRRLEKYAFEVPAFDLDARSMTLSADELNFILKGIPLSKIKYRKRYQQPGLSC
jgi:transposase